MRRTCLVLLFVVGACDSPAPQPPVTTSGVATADIVANVAVRSNGAAMLVTAGVNGKGAVRLATADVLLAGATGVPERALGEYQDTKYTWAYAVLLPSAEASGTIAFARPAGTTRQSFTLPDPFVVSAPATASRSQPIALSWNPGKTGDTFVLQIEGPCLPGVLGRTPDPIGTMFELQPADFPKYAGPCTLEVKASRRRNAVGSFAGFAATSQLALEQLRTVTIETMP